MKRLILIIILALITGIALTTCGKVIDVSEIDGTYVGTYTWSNLSSNPSLVWISTTTIEFGEGKYSYTGLSNDSYYDSGSGNFTIKGNKIIFELTDYAIPLEYIGVVDSWLLKGEYKYKFDGNKLTFSKTATAMDMKYEYKFELKRNR